MNRTKLALYTIPFLLVGNTGFSAEIDTNTAKMQAMDKITGKVSVINVPVNGNVNFGSLSIVVRSCKTRPAEETPENFAFVDITDKTQQGEQYNIFKGWMLSSSPATHAVEHPIYDVWLLNCTNTQVDASTLLSKQQLSERDNLPMQARKSVLSEKNIKEPVIEQKKKEDNSAEPVADTTEKITEPINEMEYTQPATDSEAPEILIETTDGEEFSFDEEDDMSEIQNELEQIKSEVEEVSATIEKTAPQLHNN